jgi:hypothetical protein
MRMKRHFDPEYMEKHRPRIPKNYQKNAIKRYLGIISPYRRLMYYNPGYELRALKWLCYRRMLNKHGWKKMRILLKNQERREKID